MAIDTIIHTNDQSIERVLQTKLPLVLAFWSSAQLLPPLIEATLSRSASQYASKLLIAKVDGSSESNLRQRYQVQALPTLVMIKNGKAETALNGQITSSELQSWLDYLAMGSERPVAAAPKKPAPNAQASGQPITLTDDNFAQIIQSEQPVLVDFWAPWCGPCRMVAPTVEQLATEFQGRAVVGKLNVDENGRTAQRYQIMGIPALYIFKHGQVVEQLVGVQPAQILRERLAHHVN